MDVWRAIDASQLEKELDIFVPADMMNCVALSRLPPEGFACQVPSDAAATLSCYSSGWFLPGNHWGLEKGPSFRLA